MGWAIVLDTPRLRRATPPHEVLAIAAFSLRWTLLAACLLARAPAARHSVGSLRAMATAPLPPHRRTVVLRAPGRPTLRGTLLYAAGKVHLAPRNLLGRHGPALELARNTVLVVDGAQVWLAPAGASVAHLLLGTDPVELIELLLGKVPDGVWESTDRGATVRAGPLMVAVDRNGAPTAAALGRTTIHFDGPKRIVRRGTLVFEVEVGMPVEHPPPPKAFALLERLATPRASSRRLPPPSPAAWADRRPGHP